MTKYQNKVHTDRSTIRIDWLKIINKPKYCDVTFDNHISLEVMNLYWDQKII